VSATTAVPQATGSDVAGRQVLVGALAGVLGVVAASVVGVGLAAAAGAAGLSQTPVRELGSELTALGLLGEWQQRVTSTVAAGWDVQLRLAPLLVTAAFVLVVAQVARRAGSTLAVALSAALAAGLASTVVVALGTTVVSTTNEVGAVEVTTGPRRLATALGVAVLAALAVAALRLPSEGPWAEGRRDAVAVLVWAPLVLTALAGAALVYLTSSPSLAAAVVVVLPLIGSQLLLMLVGAPLQLAIPRLTDGVTTVWTPAVGVVTALGGLLLAVLVVVAAASVRRRHGRRSARAVGPAALWGAAIGLVLSLAAGAHGSMPDGLGGVLVVAVPWWAAAVAGAALAAVGSWLAGRPRRVRRARASSAEAVEPTTLPAG
jgi:hypothetical protein